MKTLLLQLSFPFVCSAVLGTEPRAFTMGYTHPAPALVVLFFFPLDTAFF